MSDEEDVIIPCAGCPGNMKLNKDTGRFSHHGPHDPDCLWKTIEPVNWTAVQGYHMGEWAFDEDGNWVKTPPISSTQFENNVIKVDFKNRKRIE